MNSTSEKVFWDPVGGTVTAKTFEKQNEKLQTKLQSIQENPYTLKRNRTLLIAFAVCVDLIILFLLATYFSIGSGSKEIVGLLFLPVFPLIAYTAYIKKLQRDLVCSLFAQTRGWIYNPDTSKDHWKLLAASFPSIFKKGRSQYVEDEFWGTLEVDGVTYNFWKAPFTYTVQQGKHSHTYTESAIAFRLPKTFNAHLLLSPEGFRLFGDGKDDVKTESIDFNKAFTISCPGMNDGKKMDIVRALSPSVQTRLLDLQKTKGSFFMALEGNTILFCFSRYVSPLRHTNFFKKVEINSKDTEELQKELQDLLSVTGDILRYMD